MLIKFVVFLICSKKKHYKADKLLREKRSVRFSVSNTELSEEISIKKIEGKLFNLRLRTETQ